MSPSDQKLFLIFVILMVDSLFLLLMLSGGFCDVVDGTNVLPTLKMLLGVGLVIACSSHSLSCYHDMNLPWYASYDCISAHLVKITTFCYRNADDLPWSALYESNDAVSYLLLQIRLPGQVIFMLSNWSNIGVRLLYNNQILHNALQNLKPFLAIFLSNPGIHKRLSLCNTFYVY